MSRLHPRGIEPSSTDGDVLVTRGGITTWATSSGGGGGDVGVRGYREVLMATDVTPAEPLHSSDGTDWLYGEAPA